MAEELIPIENMIYEIRGHRVMLDSDLAKLYEVETKVLNQAVKRNIERFPSDFMFQLTQAEVESLRSQIVTSKEGKGGRRYNPYVFTEQGVAMLSSVLKSKRAIEVNINIMRAFVLMRQYALEQNLTDAKIEDLRKMLLLHIENTESKFVEHNTTINQIIEALNNLIRQPQPESKPIGFITPE